MISFDNPNLKKETKQPNDITILGKYVSTQYNDLNVCGLANFSEGPLIKFIVLSAFVFMYSVLCSIFNFSYKMTPKSFILSTKINNY